MQKGHLYVVRTYVKDLRITFPAIFTTWCSTERAYDKSATYLSECLWRCCTLIIVLILWK